MAYIDYEFYTDDFYGETVAPEDFARLAEEASATIDYLTFDRADAIVEAGDETDFILRIRKATCAVMDVLQNIATAGGDGVLSESVSSHRVVYNRNSESQQGRDRRCSLAAKKFLSRTGLMYRGVEDVD